MSSNSMDYQRRCAVERAWHNERNAVQQSRGSRNWTQSEQQEILATGKSHSHHGHHMLNVKAHPEHAGNENNIQFLTPKEHFQAHYGNWKIDTHGRYNPRTGKVDKIEGEIPKIQYRKLSKPLSEKARLAAIAKYDNGRPSTTRRSSQAATQSKGRSRLAVNKTNGPGETNSAAHSRTVFMSKASVHASGNSGKASTGHGQSGAAKSVGNGMGIK